MINALLFPGQGSQSVGMGKRLYEELKRARDLLELANDILGYDLKKIMFEGPKEVLADTRYAQSAIFVCSAMYLELVKARGIRYSYAAGHSLGEYNALLAAEVFRFEDGLKLVEKRGVAMSRENGKGIMAAVIGMTEEDLNNFISSYNGEAVIANLNSKSQIVISGAKEAVEDIGSQLEQKENIKFRKLNVSAAFHSPQMADAAKTMEEEIRKMVFSLPKVPVVCNVTGKSARNTEDIKENLIRQMTGQVRWCDTILHLKEEGTEQFIETGNGDVLKKLNKTIIFRPKCIGLEA